MNKIKIDTDWQHAGLRCITVDCRPWRNFMECGTHNGYVLVPESHPWHGRDYNQGDGTEPDSTVPEYWDWRDTAPDSIVNVHGGLTYSGTLLGDDGGWWFGFDTGHYRDTPEDQDEQYVIVQCERLAAQLAEVAS